MPRITPASLSRSSAEHPLRTVLIWIVTLAVGIFLVATMLDDSLTTKFEFTNTPEGQRGFDLIEDLRGETLSTNEVVIVRSSDLTVDDEEFRVFAEGLYAEIAALGPDVIREGTFENFYLTGVEALVSADRRTTIMPLIMAGDFDDATSNQPDILAIVERENAESAFEVLITGQATIGNDFEDIGQDDLLRGETFGIPIALIILILVFGTLVAAFIPVVVALISILIALGASALIGQVFALSFFVTNIVFMVGLAVGVDYSLFIIARYREERQKGFDKIDAIERTGNTASRTVLFSGLTVVLALFGMLMIPFNIFIAIGIGAIFVVVISVIAALTLLPAILSLLGDRLNRLSVPFFGRTREATDEDGTGGFWDRVSHWVMRYPAISIIVAGGLLVAAAYPALDLSTGYAGISTFADDIQSKQGFEILDAEFSAGETTPAQIVISGEINSAEVQAGVDALIAAMAGDPSGVYGTPRELEIGSDGRLAVLEVPLNGDSAEAPAEDAVKRLREEYVPAAFGSLPATDAYVTGETAYNLDFFKMAKDAVWIVFPFVLGMSFILLMIVFRSIIVPIKAIILNLLAVAATYGLLVLMFQKGVGEDLGIFVQYDIIEAWIPLFLFTILFGLSMDYHYFLLSRIRERFDQTGDNTESVAFGIRSTGRLITGAALIMVAVFWAFAAGDLVGLQQMGFGLGTAILIDATIIRMVLVPASMKLLGEWNWYLPPWLSWLPEIRVESGEPAGGAIAQPESAGDG